MAVFITLTGKNEPCGNCETKGAASCLKGDSIMKSPRKLQSQMVDYLSLADLMMLSISFLLCCAKRQPTRDHN